MSAETALVLSVLEAFISAATLVVLIGILVMLWVRK